MNTSHISVAIFLLLTCLVSQTPAVAYAQAETDANATATATEAVSEVTTLKEKVLARIGLSERKQERITNLGANISNRLEGVIDRFEIIAKRLEKRAKKLEAQGYTVDVARAELKEAERLLQTTKEHMANIDTQIKNAVTSEKPQEAWVSIASTFTDVRKELIEIKQILSQVLLHMKEAQVQGVTKQASQATTTPTE